MIVRLLYKVGLGCSTHVIFQNQDDLAEFTSKHLVKRDKCGTVNGSGVNMSQFTPAAPPAKISFLMISRLLKSKGVCEYMEAAGMVKKKFPDVEFGLLGKYENKMQDAVPRSHVDSFIAAGVIIRYEETSDVRPYYRKCSVYVLPSYREGTPRTVLEAMASARPIITTNATGCRQTVQDGKTGFLVPVYDSMALAEKMEWFVQNPHAIDEMGRAALQYCKEEFDVNVVNNCMLQMMGIKQRRAADGAN